MNFCKLSHDLKTKHRLEDTDEFSAFRWYSIRLTKEVFSIFVSAVNTLLVNLCLT